MEYENLLVKSDGPVAVVTINRPDKLNALNNQTMLELKDFLMSAKEDSSIGAIVLTGAGEKAFVAGADIGEINTLTPSEAAHFALRGQRIFGKLSGSAKPTIAAVNGFALGGGCELAMACHLRVASENAKFGQPEVKLGIIPGYGGTQRLARLVGRGRALELLLTGEMIGAEEAYRIGLVNHIYPLSELVPKAVELAGKMLANGPLALKYCIAAVNYGQDSPLDKALAHEAHLFGLSCATEDMKEGTAAFLEKRKPEFKRR
ncbi:MAG: enoyl-CoA hydratase/isomerase family protein [bacterium]